MLKTRDGPDNRVFLSSLKISEGALNYHALSTPHQLEGVARINLLAIGTQRRPGTLSTLGFAPDLLLLGYPTSVPGTE